MVKFVEGELVRNSDKKPIIIGYSMQRQACCWTLDKNWAERIIGVMVVALKQIMSHKR